MVTVYDIIFFSLIGGVFSLIGGLLLLAREDTAQNLARFAAPFAAGALLGAAFLDILPEGIALSGSPATVLTWSLWGILLFFVLERFLHWFHHHDHSGHAHEKDGKAVIPLIIIGDTIHNFIDGVAIALAFLVSMPVGIVTTFAVAAHEIPQEIGDFGLLLKLGMARRSVVLVNIASAFATVVGAVATYYLGTANTLPQGQLLGLTAGLFIYIAASDIIPTIHRRTQQRIVQAETLLLILGVLVVLAATQLSHLWLENNNLDSRQSGEHHQAESSHQVENHHSH